MDRYPPGGRQRVFDGGHDVLDGMLAGGRIGQVAYGERTGEFVRVHGCTSSFDRLDQRGHEKAPGMCRGLALREVRKTISASRNAHRHAGGG